MTAPRRAALLVGFVTLAACAPTPQVDTQRYTLTGKDGAYTASGTAIVNTYVTLTTDAAANDTTLSVNDASAFSAGDLIVVVSTQGAAIDVSESATYGTITNLGAAGKHELWELSAVNTTTDVLTLKAGCGLSGLQNAYPLTSHPQVIRVPQYTTLSVPSGATITGAPWNGVTGGYVILHVETSASIDGVIDANGLGLRGGAVSLGTATITDTISTYSDMVGHGGEKGESVAGATSDYDSLSGRYGRGAPGNGGGGGDGYLGGGGGGASLLGTSATAYSGEGTMLASVTGGSAWSHDPGFGSSGGPGGGRGGYTLSASNQDALTVGPGSALWGGNGRLERGGLGGHPLSGSGRLFLGGGGGAGHFDGSALPASVAGARGGGVVYLIADALSGAGTIRADGQAGRDGQIVGTNDPGTVGKGGGAGGGGAGGMVLLRAIGSGVGLSVSARGGAGGGVSLTGTFDASDAPASGPGGGGAGGAVALYSGLTLGTTPLTTAGLGGTTSAPALAEFPSNGASAGDPGSVVTGISQTATPAACLPADVSVTLTDSADPVDTNSAFTYTATLQNLGPNAAYDLVATIDLPAGAASGTITAPGWSCMPVGTVVTCTRASLRSTISTTIAVAMTAPASATTLNATASVSSRQDPASGNNSAGKSTTVQLPQVDLSLDKTGPSTVASGEQLTYTLTVTNLGPRAAPSLQVVDTLPAGTTFVSSSGTGWTCTPSGSTVTCSFGSLASGAGSIVTLVVSAPALTSAGSITNDATVSLTSSGAMDPVSANDSASVTTQVIPVDLSITKSDVMDPVTASGALTYVLTVTNPASVPAHSVVVSDVLPGGTAFVSASGTGWACALMTDTIRCTRATIAASPTTTPAITVVLTAPSTQGIISNTATVSSTATDPQLGNNTATEQTTISPPAPGSADVSITIADAPDPVDLDAALTYTITVANAGPDPAAGVQVVGTLPAGATFGSISGSGWSCMQADTTVTCSPSGALAVGTAAPITLSMTAPASPGMITASVVVTAATPDPSVANNSAVASTDVIDPTRQNKPPVLTLPTMLSTLEETVLTLSGANAPRVEDPDAGPATVELRASSATCVLTLATTNGLAFTTGDGILDPELAVRGSIVDLDAALDGASVTPVPAFVGTATLTLTVDDLGNTGAGGAMQTTGGLVITVIPVDKPPRATDDDASVVEDTQAARIDVLANDAGGAPGRTLSVVSVTAAMSGTAAISDAKDAVTYTPSAGFLGDDLFTYTMTDGASQATATVVVHVVPPTIAPIAVTLGGGGLGCTVAAARPGTSTGIATLLVALLAWALRRRRYRA